MTCIAWDGKTLAADKRAVNNGFKGGTVTKIHRWDGRLCALSGEFDAGMQMVEWLRAGEKREDFPKKQAEHAASFMVILRDGSTFRYETVPVRIYMENVQQAMGSGRDYALAAMHLGCDAEKAVRVACALDNGCGNGVDTLQIEEE